MASTRLQLITRALRTVGDTSLTSEATDWITNVLNDIEAVGMWRFLYVTTTHQTETGVSSVAFSASKWPSAAITDFSKGLSISSTSTPFSLTLLSKDGYDRANDSSTGLPSHYAFANETVFFYPIPVTGSLPLLTSKYYKEIPILTADGDDIETVTGIKPQWHPVIEAGVVLAGALEIEDGRVETFAAIYRQKLGAMILVNSDSFDTAEQSLDKSALLNRSGLALFGAGQPQSGAPV